MITKKENEENTLTEKEDTLAKKADKSNQFLIGAFIVFIIAILSYKLLISPMLEKMELYHQAEVLYDHGNYAQAGKTFEKLGSYKNADQRKKEIEKKPFQIYFQNKEMEMKSNYPEIYGNIKMVRYLYRDMDGDGLSECCAIDSLGGKHFCTYKNGEAHELYSDYGNAGYVVCQIYETKNLISVMSLDKSDNSGYYSENFYSVKGTELHLMASRTVSLASCTPDQVEEFVKAMESVENGSEYQLSEELISEKYCYRYGEDDDEEDYDEEDYGCDEQDYKAYIAEITGNEKGSNGGTDKLAGWEVENNSDDTTRAGSKAYYGGRSSASEFKEKWVRELEEYYEEYPEDYPDYYGDDDDDYPDYDDDDYPDYDDDDYPDYDDDDYPDYDDDDYPDDDDY